MKSGLEVYQILIFPVRKLFSCRLLVFLLVAGLQSVALHSASPIAVYLSWVDDPSTTMVVQWVEASDVKKSVLRIYKNDDGKWEETDPVVLPIEHTDCSIKRVFLENLEPGCDYSFEIVVGKKRSRVYQFKTMPKDLEQPVDFVVGGDIYYHYGLFRKMNEVVASLSPDFVVLGGDIAYAFSHSPAFFKQSDWQWRRWRTFLECWTEQMIDDEGRLIPLLAVVGNHDVCNKYSKRKCGVFTTSLFYTIFPFKEEKMTYRSVLFGDYLALFLLDSGHTHPIAGTQTAWLKATLPECQSYPYKMAAYHVPAYPSYSRIRNHTSTHIREEWSPLFDQYGVQTAFAHHNHTYKRTKPLRDGKIDEKGVVYLGDGSWGVPLRRPRTPEQEWYLEKSGQFNAVYYVRLEKDACRIFAIDNKGKIIDKVPEIMPQEG